MSRLVGVLLFAPVATVNAYLAFLGGAAVVGGLAAGSDDVAFASDSGMPGWLMAALGLVLLAAVTVLLYVAWRVAFDRASIALLIVALVLSLPPLQMWVFGLAEGGIGGLVSALGVAPYFLALTVWRLSQRLARRQAAPEQGA